MVSRSPYVRHIDLDGNHGEQDRRDRPLLGRWQLEDPDALRDVIDWLHAATRRVDRVEQAFVAEAMHAGRSRYTSYSRRKDWYASDARHYLPSDFGYRPVIEAVGQLDHLGLIDHDRKRPSAVSRGFQSRLRASEMLMQFATERHPILRCSPRSPLILRDEDGHQIRFRDTAWTRAVVRNVAVIEEMLSSTRIDLDDATPCLWRSGDFMELSDHKHHPYSIHLAHVPITRIFNNGTFEHGGRFVGPPYQSWPKGIRPYITLDGEPTEELDYGQTHVRMLCAQAGLDIKANDVFKIPGGFDREIVKTMFYILINATSLDSALLAMQDEKPRYKGKRAQAIAITEAIKEQFPALVPYLHTGAGLWLMWHESDIAEDVLLNLTARGIAAMPIHDSFVVEAKNAPVLEQIMRDSWSKFVASEATVKYKPKPSVFSPLQQNVPTSVVVYRLEDRPPL